MLWREALYLMNTLVIMLSAFLKDSETSRKGQTGAKALAAFQGENFYQFHSLKDRLFVLQATQKAVYQELVDVLKALFSLDELTAVNQVLREHYQYTMMKMHRILKINDKI